MRLLPPLPVILPKFVLFIAAVGAPRLVKLKTLTASPRNSNVAGHGYGYSRTSEASISR